MKEEKENVPHTQESSECYTLSLLFSITCVCVSVEEALQSLLEKLTCPPFTPTQHLEREQALAKQFAEILHFTLRFDELKVCCKLSSTHFILYEIQ